MLSMLIAFVNTHFNALLGGIVAESAIVAMIYSFFTADAVFAFVLVAFAALVAFAGARAFAKAEKAEPARATRLACK